MTEVREGECSPVSKGRGLLNWVMQPMVSSCQSYTASSGQRALLDIQILN